MMGINRHVVVAETDREAMEIGRRAYRRWFENFTALWRMRNVPLPKNIAYSEDFDGIVRNEQAIAGSPSTVRSAIARQMEQSGASYFLARLAFGDLALGESLASAELFARRVMPEVATAPAA
jgi:alkanesulfonate monooxygenase SsuD/methylene tetrahydromethanopterin reductase-like flavin-dependent oxidoreductase (luciferase family)